MKIVGWLWRWNMNTLAMQNPYSHICLKLRCLIWCVVTWMFRSTFWEKHGWQSNGPKLNKSKPFENLAGVVGWRRLCEEALSGHAPYIFHHFPTNHNIQGISHPRNRFDRQHLVAPKHHPPLEVVQHHVQHLHCYYYPLQEIDFELEHSLREWQVKQLNQNSISPKEHMLGQMHLSKLNHCFFQSGSNAPYHNHFGCGRCFRRRSCVHSDGRNRRFQRYNGSWSDWWASISKPWLHLLNNIHLQRGC